MKLITTIGPTIGIVLFVAPVLDNTRAAEVITWPEDLLCCEASYRKFTNIVAISAGEFSLLGLNAEGRVIAWGGESPNNYGGHMNVPNDLTNAVAIAAGFHHSLALTAEGRVVAWGEDGEYQDVSLQVPRELTNVVAISAGEHNNLALTTKGRVVAWGGSETTSRLPNSLRNVVAIAAGGAHCTRGGHNLAVTGDGRVVAWGSNVSGTCADSPRFSSQATVPLGLGFATDIAGGGDFSIVVSPDGIAKGWGGYEPIALPETWRDIITLSAGSRHALALTESGQVLAWGPPWAAAVTNVPLDLTNVVAVEAGGWSDYLYGAALVGLPPGLAAPQLIGPHALMATTDWPFRHRIVAKNGVTAYGAIGLPPGLMLDTTRGIISGVPTASGSYVTTLLATNSVGHTSRQITIHVNEPFPYVEESKAVVVLFGQPAAFRVPAYFGTTYEATGLPTSLTLDAATGEIRGTAEVEGEFRIDLTVRNRFRTATGLFLLRVTSNPNPVLSNPRFTSDGVFEFMVSGLPARYGVQFTTDLLNWVNLPVAVSGSGFVQMAAPWFSTERQIFFRAIKLDEQ